MSKSIEELKIGTYDGLHVVSFNIEIMICILYEFFLLLKIEENTLVIDALHYFVKYRVSALPVVDKNRKLVNIYSKFDVIVSHIENVFLCVL